MGPDGWKKKADVRQPSLQKVNSESHDNRQPNDPFLTKELIAVRELTEEEWLKGKTIQISGLQPSSGYLVRLIAVNDAGATHGDIVEVFTKASKDSGANRLQERRTSNTARELGIE